MKAVILTMTSGEGHNSIARSISLRLEKLGVESQILDIFRHDGFEYKFNNWGFLFICSYFPHTYDACWKQLKFRKSKYRYTGVAQREVEKVADFVSTQVEECDFFVCVHPYTAMLCDLWKRQGKFQGIPAFAILTDLLPHPLWESAIECNKVLTPTTHSFEQLKTKGFDKSQLEACGFAVSDKYLLKREKSQMRKELGLKDRFTVLICGGGYGIGKNWKVVKKLLPCSVQILCVNGKNKKAFEKTASLQKKHPEDVFNFGFVDNLNELMCASDVIVTRAGAATLFEAMLQHLPIVIREKSIINERENAEILQKEGAAIRLKKLKELPKVIAELQSNPEKIATMQAACDKMTGRKCVNDICDRLLELANK